jgi:uncharacterized membrane protein
VGRYLDEIATNLQEPVKSIVYVIYYAIPHLEWSFGMRNLIIHDWPLIDWSVVGMASVYYLFYIGVFLAAACLVFRRKPVN